ncbi:unnamed protein product [Protopolystoma xenopodis]|uniref:Uncharacterized protein n=1 Tax=Protopolystoma xenopodis TaxID=117903 RepID=A0A3S5A511_9PLAT|nr:unnamed protein product [Protopolystoma xenopodis]
MCISGQIFFFAIKHFLESVYRDQLTGLEAELAQEIGRLLNDLDVSNRRRRDLLASLHAAGTLGGLQAHQTHAHAHTQHQLHQLHQLQQHPRHSPPSPRQMQQQQMMHNLTNPASPMTAELVRSPVQFVVNAVAAEAEHGVMI